MKRRAVELLKAVAAAQAALEKYQNKCKHINSARLPKSKLFNCDDCGKRWVIECKHKHVKRVPKANICSYDPSADHYWYERKYKCKCEDCGHHWTEDQ